MVDACGNTCHPDYHLLGGTGVVVCGEWRDNFANFYEWALAHGYEDTHWLIRVRLDEGYSLNNCRWVASRTYQQYLRSCQVYTAFGETKRIGGWLSDPRCVVTAGTLNVRLKAGWPIERALTEPTSQRPASVQQFTITTIPIGAQFGRLTVTGPVESEKFPGRKRDRTEYYYRCRCRCGSPERRVTARNLLKGMARSCGCLQREIVRAQSTIHGETGKTRLLKVWTQLKNSCFIPSAKLYQSRGQRGIALCSEWTENYCEFRDWALANGYTDQMFLRRHDIRSDFSPANCYWSTEQAKGTIYDVPIRQSYVTAFGETRTLVEWAHDSRCKVGAETLMSRIKLGWCMERALTAPLYGKPQPGLAGFGEIKTKLEWADDPRRVVPRTAFFDRLRQGWHVEEALVTPLGSTLPTHMVTAFGEIKRVSEWARDPRCVVSAPVLASRLDKGWEPEKALTTQVIRNW